MKYVALCLCLFLAGSALAQSAEQQVEKVIYDIFDGMREGDSTKVSGHFVKDATMLSVFYDKEGKSTMREGSLQGWLNAIATPRDEILDERLWDVEVRVDKNLAQVWTYYALYVGENYHHCGVDAFQLFHDGNNWKVFHIADTRRLECDIPESVKNPGK